VAGTDGRPSSPCHPRYVASGPRARMLNEHGRTLGDGSILDTRLLRLMREQNEEGGADDRGREATPAPTKSKRRGKWPRPIDRTARLSGPSENAKVRYASTPQPPPAPLSVPIRSLRDHPRSCRKCRRDLRDRRRSLRKSRTHHRGIQSCPRNAPILPPRALAAILNVRLKLIHYPRIQATVKSGRRTGQAHAAV
jgi:hypothetical protein